MKMKRRHYYVVEASFFSGNPNHRYIVECEDSDTQCMTFINTEDQLVRTPERLYSFEVISEITDMNANRPWEQEES